MRNNAGGLFEVVWFILGGLMLFMAVDSTLSVGIKESWYYYVFALLAFGMYYMRRRMRMQNK